MNLTTLNKYHHSTERGKTSECDRACTLVSRSFPSSAGSGNLEHALGVIEPSKCVDALERVGDWTRTLHLCRRRKLSRLVLQWNRI